MSRYPPDQRFPPRDRSPARFQERRASTAFNNYQGAGPGNRSLDENANPSATRDPPREPPRGPKALENTPRGSSFAPSGPRGRGFGGRLDFHDREYYNARDAPQFRRDGDSRDWTRRERDFDGRESRPTYGRGKSRSPLRDFRDTREGDIGRIRRDSGASLPQNNEPSVSHVSHLRGLSSRGRGRGEWDRGRGRGTTFIDDRADFRPRSRSRERIWERDRRDEREWGEREPGRDRADRRDDDRRPEYTDRRWKETRSPSRTGSLTNPSTPHPPSVASSLPPSADKAGVKDGYDPSRRISNTSYTGTREGRIEEKPDYFSTRHEPSKERYTPRVASPPPAPQVPAFGSVNPKTSISVTPASGPKTPSEKHHQPLTTQASSTVSATTALSTSSAIQSRPEVKNSVSQAVVLAPTGPRAERSEKQSDVLSRDIPKGIDSWNRHDVPFRGNVSLSNPVAGRLAVSNSTVGPYSISDVQGTILQIDAMQSKSPVLQSAQGRPGSSSSQTLNRNLSGLATSPGLSSSAPTRPLASITSPRAPISNIPTGPRAQRELMPTSQRPAARGSMQWISPKAPQYPPRGPSIMNTVPVRAGYRPEDKDRPPSSGKGAAKSPTSEHSPSLERRTILSPRQASRLQSTHASDAPRGSDEGGMHGHKTQLEEQKEANLPVSLGQSSDEVGEDEDMDLDEEDFEEAEKKFELDMEALKLRKPPPTLKDPVIVDLLFQLQALEIMANDSTHQTADEAMEIDKVTPEQQQQPPGLPSPTLQEGEQPAQEERQPPLKELPFNRPPTPRIEDLPFLNAGPLTPFSEMDEIQEVLAAFGRNEEALRGQLLDQMDAASYKNDELRRKYAALYRPWRLEVREMDQAKRKTRKEITPLPASPPPAVTPTVTPAPPEGRRALKFGSEFDLERVMQESVQTHREEQEKRESAAKARADPRREAVIPDMREDYEADNLQFIDGNGLVRSMDALHVFRYVPPTDDFTPEEHDVFLKAYVMFPKKFGRIAEALPENRDFKQCIQHYYLTKQEVNYKAECNKGMRRKGRKRGKPSRTNALLSDLDHRGYDGGEFDMPPAPVTDTGRPRRAAAPTFGDTPVDTDGSGTNGAVPMRRGAPKEPGDQPLEKPARRPRGGGAPRGSRKSRLHQPVAVVPGPSPQRLTSLQLSPQKDEQRQDLEGANLLASLHNPRAEDRPLMPHRDAQMPGPPPADSGPSRPTKQKAWTGGQTPTSYWSVPEQNDFPKYVAHFGKDYVAIATYMQTKTPIMVKNYFLRSVEQGKWELEEMAQHVEEKRQRGEPMGQPPPRTMVAKRRYDATPSSTSQRPLAPNTDGMDLVDSGSPPALRPTQPQPHPQPQHSPPSLATSQPKLHPHIMAQQAQSSSPLPLTAPAGENRPKMHRPAQGPRVGFFTDERKDTLAGPHMGSAHQQSQQPVPPPVGQSQQILRTEPVHTSTWRQMPEQGPPKIPHMQQTTQQQASALHQASAPTLRDHLITHGGNLTVDIVDGQPQTVFKREDDNPSLRRIEQYSLHPKDFRPPMQDKVLSPTENPYSSHAKEVARPSSTPAQVPEAPRPAPAPTKRINIMSMLNDEVETQPPKRLKEVHDETPKMHSPASTYQSQSLPLSRVDSQSHNATPVQAHSQPYTSAMQYALQHQAQPQLAQQPRSAGGYPEAPRWAPQSQRTHSEWINQFDPRPSRGGAAYSPRLTTTNSPPVHTAFAPPPATILRHGNQQAISYPQHAPSPPPQPAHQPHQPHQSHYRSTSQQQQQQQQQQHGRMPSYGHQPSPTVGPQHPTHTGPPPIPAIHRHPYAAPSPPPAAQAQAPPPAPAPPQQARPGNSLVGSRDYFPQQLYHHASRPVPGQPMSREMEIRREEEQHMLQRQEMLRQQAELERRQPSRTFTPPSSRPPWGPYSGDRSGGGGNAGGSGGSGEKREIY